ncbi:ABC transporter ATP-binding protein/permease [Brackiella oedipodis]|uniref:ABC transporter ATP-binding protein/permease n=1 Tax=Brackiella oedipodis TaxID=124225 RepID=UPI00048C46E8|nr:ABC transporter ATP-binding protein/permease [Brackiella oedipodis]
MDWAKELLDSGHWIVMSFVGSVIGVIIVGLILIKTTTWAQQFWLIGGQYFNPRRHPKSLVMFAIILFLSLFGVRINILFSNWYNSMYSALQAKNESVFWMQMGVFSVLALIHVIRILVSFYLQQRFIIGWRETLNDQLLTRWMQNKSYYRLFFLKQKIDNPDQRIQQDVTEFANTSMTLMLGVVTSLVSTVSFTWILWGLSGDINIFGVTIPRGMVFILFIYVLIATVFAFKIGRPLIRLNFLDERLNANYRYSLIRVREYAESIAFYGGEKIERSKLLRSFKQIIQNYWAIVFRSLKFQGFNLGVSQLAVIFPFIVQAPRFFADKLSLGDMVQTAQAFGQLQDSLSFFRTVYDDFAGYKATLFRLASFYQSLDQTESLPVPNRSVQAHEVSLQHVNIYTPAQEALVQDLSFAVAEGQSLLLQGPSGAGKTTILRTVAGLWPYADGQIVCPKEDTIFLSQKPYLPEGNLLDVLYYPEAVPHNALEQATTVLKKVNLGHLIAHLQEESHWMHTLSQGEQQRVAFARLLLLKPKVAFLDEATSAMDEGLEDAMYRLVHEELPNLRLISVGHRSTLKVHHSDILALEKGGHWRLEKLSSTQSV